LTDPVSTAFSGAEDGAGRTGIDGVYSHYPAGRSGPTPASGRAVHDMYPRPGSAILLQVRNSPRSGPV